MRIAETPIDIHHPQLLARLFGAVRRGLRMIKVHRRERSLRLCETVSLGEKRCVAVVQFEGQRFLLGVTGQSVVLLQALGECGALGEKKSAENSGDSF